MRSSKFVSAPWKDNRYQAETSPGRPESKGGLIGTIFASVPSSKVKISRVGARDNGGRDGTLIVDSGKVKAMKTIC